MRVFVAGASGAIGTRLVPQLIDRGHEVIGTFRSSPEKAEHLRALRTEAIALDLLDAPAVRKAVLDSRPDAIVHQATALADARFGRNLDRTFAPTNLLRTEGTDNLLAAAREAGVRRFVAQSFANYRYAREGGPVKTEHDPLDPAPPATTRETGAAMRHVDEAVTKAGGIALRYGGFYGGASDGLVKPVRKRRFPITGDGGGSLVFARLQDAGRKVRVLRRRSREDGEGIEFAAGDLAKDEGIEAAVEGAEIIVHCAGTAKGDEDKARNLVRAASRAGTRHLVYISVVGDDRIPVESGVDRAMFGYFASKLAAERVVADSG